MQQRLVAAGLLKGKTVAVDATMLEANAAMRSIVRRDTGESYQEFLTGPRRRGDRDAHARGPGAPGPQAQEKNLERRLEIPGDPDAKIAKMKDGRTHLAYKAEHAVDLETGALIAVTLQDVTRYHDDHRNGHCRGGAKRRRQAEIQAPEPLVEIIADKGYHSNQTMIDLAAVGLRTYVAEPDRGRRDWSQEP